MRKLITLISLLILVEITFQQCANPGRPTGGPKDTIPPTLLKSYPVTGQTNFKDNELVLEFSEYVSADKIKQQLIITPESDLKYKSIVKRNKVFIQLEGELTDSITYNFNFADGIVDITEKNPAKNLSIAFSTGPYIDSLEISGFLQDLLTQDPGQEYVVGLYPYTDSLDFFSSKPMYFTTSNDSGRYSINYIKRGIYKLLTFEDENGNYILDPETESHGFLSDTLDLRSKRELPIINTVLQNVKPISLINARPTGPYIEIKFTREPSKYTIRPDYISNHLVGENKDVIRLYKPQNTAYKDSLETTVTAQDSLGNELQEDLKIIFLESNRKPGKYSYTVSPTRVTLPKDSTITITFNKPSQTINLDSIAIKADSIYTYFLHGELLWNDNRTQATYTYTIDTTKLYDGLRLAIPTDTAQQDSTTNKSKRPKTTDRKLEIHIPKASFKSVEQDTSELKTIAIKKPEVLPTGLLKLQVVTEKQSYQIQLLRENGTIAYSTKDLNKSIQFKNIKAGTYTIRVLIDTNNDGTWSYGNLLNDQQPEEVYINPEQISIRENWEVEMSITF